MEGASQHVYNDDSTMYGQAMNNVSAKCIQERWYGDVQTRSIDLGTWKWPRYWEC